jgi:hypothetical protein
MASVISSVLDRTNSFFGLTSRGCRGFEEQHVKKKEVIKRQLN